jgi:hypothetical protein
MATALGLRWRMGSRRWSVRWVALSLSLSLLSEAGKKMWQLRVDPLFLMAIYQPCALGKGDLVAFAEGPWKSEVRGSCQSP